MGTCRSARQASWEEVAAVNESPLLTLGNLVLRWHSDLGIPRNGALLFSRPCRPEVNVSMQLLGRTIEQHPLALCKGRCADQFYFLQETMCPVAVQHNAHDLRTPQCPACLPGIARGR